MKQILDWAFVHSSVRRRSPRRRRSRAGANYQLGEQCEGREGLLGIRQAVLQPLDCQLAKISKGWATVVSDGELNSAGGILSTLIVHTDGPRVLRDAAAVPLVCASPVHSCGDETTTGAGLVAGAASRGNVVKVRAADGALGCGLRAG